MLSYNISKNTWKTYDSDSECFNKALSGHSGEIIMDNKMERLILFGGLDENSTYINQLYILPTLSMYADQIDIKKNRKGIAIYPSARAYHSSNYSEGEKKIYIYGGTDMNISNSK